MKKERLMVTGRVQICALFAHNDTRGWWSLTTRTPEARLQCETALKHLVWLAQDGEGLPHGTPMAMKDAIRWVSFISKYTAAEAITIEKESV